MNCLITGADENGRSFAWKHFAPQPAEIAPGLEVAGLFATKVSPPALDPAGKGEFVDLGVAPGLAGLNLWRFGAGEGYPMHHTDTIDVDTVLEGSIELLLDDGAHQLSARDCAVVTGVEHAWRAGPQGCLMLSIAVGSARLSASD